MFHKQKYIIVIIVILFLPMQVNADTNENIFADRLALYKKTEALTQIPWYYIAAIDQYERNLETNPASDQLLSLKMEPEKWYGPGNITEEKDEAIISLFGGLGKDGNGDGLADPNDPEDMLYSFFQLILASGYAEEDIKIALFNYYKRDLAVKTIVNNARVFKKFQHLELTDRDFPVSVHHNYSYRSTWGDRRGFGGLRIHEGTDIFANYGTPVQATTYGVVEIIGWNLYGGWRVGIRDIHNIYHYYAHLNNYSDDLELGQVIKPGDVIGSVGSSGYGPPGTAGKFPPHLHYGMYKDNGYSEWSFDPYPYLRRWEQIARAKR